MTRRLATAREQVEMLSPWRVAMPWDEWTDQIKDLRDGTDGWYEVDHGLDRDDADENSHLIFSLNPDRTIDIGDISVHPRFRGRGIAEAFMRRLHQDYPDHKIHPGGMTPEGKGFHDRMIGKEPNARDVLARTASGLWAPWSRDPEREGHPYAEVWHAPLETGHHLNVYRAAYPPTSTFATYETPWFWHIRGAGDTYEGHGISHSVDPARRNDQFYLPTDIDPDYEGHATKEDAMRDAEAAYMRLVKRPDTKHAPSEIDWESAINPRDDLDEDFGDIFGKESRRQAAIDNPFDDEDFLNESFNHQNWLHCPDCRAPYGYVGPNYELRNLMSGNSVENADHERGCEIGDRLKSQKLFDKNQKAFDPKLDYPNWKPGDPHTIRSLAAEYGMTPRDLQHYSDMRETHPDEPLSGEDEDFLRDLVENSVDGVYQRDPNWNPDDGGDPFDPRTFGANLNKTAQMSYEDAMRYIDETLAAGEPEDKSDYSTDYWEPEPIYPHEVMSEEYLNGPHPGTLPRPGLQYDYHDGVCDHCAEDSTTDEDGYCNNCGESYVDDDSEYHVGNDSDDAWRHRAMRKGTFCNGCLKELLPSWYGGGGR